MRLSILHRTTFVYAGDAHDSFNEVRLRPVDDTRQRCLAFTLRTDPGASPTDYVDFHENTVHYFDVINPHEQLVIEAVSEVETTPDGERPPVPAVPFAAIRESGARDLEGEFLAPSRYVPLDPALEREAQEALAAGRSDIWSDVKTIAGHVRRTFQYKPGSTGVSTLATDALQIRSGVCQDFAHVTLAMCRCAGIPARYVSGYFLNVDLRPQDEEASHAWIEALVPGHGWAGYDPTHDRAADQRYIKLASGRDYGDTLPVGGTYRGAPTRSFRVDVRVRPAVAEAATS